MSEQGKNETMKRKYFSGLILNNDNIWLSLAKTPLHVKGISCVIWLKTQAQALLLIYQNLNQPRPNYTHLRTLFGPWIPQFRNWLENGSKFFSSNPSIISFSKILLIVYSINNHSGIFFPKQFINTIFYYHLSTIISTLFWNLYQNYILPTIITNQATNFLCYYLYTQLFFNIYRISQSLCSSAPSCLVKSFGCEDTEQARRAGWEVLRMRCRETSKPHLMKSSRCMDTERAWGARQNA